ncbi:hypothetical protein [Roseibium sp. RKSG952]|uniref:hypothetical protein n=1 Tax=Roseibium sp. RKSG952 TaxID=2529384 RepID=UPI0012BB92DF|nr:hypothetical protein [Roseibium sp. RKSG952]MTI01539.1 hypothetical protein [Roseibium sp. RKSG952]
MAHAASPPWVFGALHNPLGKLGLAPPFLEPFKLLGKILHTHFFDLFERTLRPILIPDQASIETRSNLIHVTKITAFSRAMPLIADQISRKEPFHPQHHWMSFVGLLDVFAHDVALSS